MTSHHELRLDRFERDYYDVAITTDPALPGPWEASFDGGTTWHTGEAHNGGWRWLVRGPDAEVGASVARIPGTMRPRVRCVANPVIVVEVAPRITVVS